ncbi:MAG: hypothetical protein ACR2HX_22245 [Pyrinomonadaceae bacterium]
MRDLILERHAQFASGMQQLREAQRHTEQAVNHAGEIVAQAGGIIARLAKGNLEGL